MARTQSPSTVAITGASSGIGAALARCYARPGVHLVLMGRNSVRLAEVARLCRGQGATSQETTLDVSDREGLRQAVRAADAAAPIDLMIANAGILEGEPGSNGPEPLRDTVAQIDTNLLGAIATADAVLDRMLARGRGQIAFNASLAAYTPSPDWPGYCASKAGLLSYGLSLRERHRNSGVRINVICPGWVSAPINDPFEMRRPFEMSADKAASIIARGLARDQAVIAFPLALAWSAPIVMLLPAALRRFGSRFFKARRKRR